MPSRCLLARVYETPMGRFVYHPAFRYSPEATARQTADGQPARPEDAYALSDDPMLGGVVVECAHHHSAVPLEKVRTDLDRAKASGRVHAPAAACQRRGQHPRGDVGAPFSNRIEDGRAATLARPVAGAAVRRGSCIPGPVRSKPWAALRAGRSQDRRRRVDRLPPSRCGAVDDGTERGIVCLGALTERLHQAGPERFEIANRLVDLLHPLGEP